MKVILLDADKQEREMVRECLVKKGFSVAESEGGTAMIEDMEQFKKDLVIVEQGTWNICHSPPF